MGSIDLQPYLAAIRRGETWRRTGRVRQVIGMAIESEGPHAGLGEICTYRTRQGRMGQAEVVGFRGGRNLLFPLGDMDGVAPGLELEAVGRLGIPVGRQMLGRVINATGRPLDEKPPWPVEGWRELEAAPPPALSRQPIREPLPVGVKAIDGCLSVGRGQRIGLFAGSGVGKSTLLGMMARYTEAGVIVLCLVGERGREMREFLERELGQEGLARAVVVVSTSDESPLLRLKAPLVATAVAEYFRDRGTDVLLLMDSLTRYAMAQREVGLALGEPPTARGYTPSVFSLLPRLLERSGMAETGSITAFYTVLMEGDDLEDPIVDTVRAILDGHILLTRRLAEGGHYPPIDILASVSRLVNQILPEHHLVCIRQLREALARYREAEDLIQIGAYKMGGDPQLDWAIACQQPIRSFLCQPLAEGWSWDETQGALVALFGKEDSGEEA